MALSNTIKNFFNSLCCGGGPCSGYIPHTTSSIAGNTVTLSGGNSAVPSECQIHVNGVLYDTILLDAGENSFVFPDYDPNACTRLNWKSACDPFPHYGYIGNCDCNVFIPHTSVSITGTTVSLFGGNSQGQTAWTITDLEGNMSLSGTLESGQHQFDFPDYDPDTCYNVFWNSGCDIEQGQGFIGSCPCSVFLPHTSAVVAVPQVTLVGGNSVGKTNWEIYEDGSEVPVASGQLAAGFTQFNYNGFQDDRCFTIRWKGACESTWHEFAFGNCL